MRSSTNKRSTCATRSRDKQEKEMAWRFTIEQIGQELRKVYPAREKLPPQLRTLATQIEVEIGAQRRGRRSTKPKGD